MNMPKLKINGARRIHNLPLVESFTDTTADGVIVHLRAREEKDGSNVYEIGSNFQIVGWTTDAQKGFCFLRNAGVYTFAELYDVARGRKV